MLLKKQHEIIGDTFSLTIRYKEIRKTPVAELTISHNPALLGGMIGRQKSQLFNFDFCIVVTDQITKSGLGIDILRGGPKILLAVQQLD